MMRKKRQHCNPCNPTPIIMEKGEVTETKYEKQIEWKINRFLSHLEEFYKCYTSPSFTFNSESWYLQITEANKVYSICLCKESNEPPITVEFSVAIKTIYGVNDLERHYTAVFEKTGTPRQPRQPLRLMSRNEFLKRKTVFVPSGSLTVVCSLKNPKTTGSRSADGAVENELLYQAPNSGDQGENIPRECYTCKKTLSDEFISLHEKCIDRPIKCINCSVVVQLQNGFYNHKCPTENVKGDDSIFEEFKKMLSDGQNHDLVLKVGEKELRAHKDVLMARSRVFESMLSHDMVEKNSGVINAPDCDPQAMNVFLQYLYSGKVDTQDQSTLLGLYYIADKYEMLKLKNDCCNFIKEFLSPLNFCEVVLLAIKHSDYVLLEFATAHFVNNMADILRTVEWQVFLKDNSTVANELLIKACDRKK